MAENLNNKHKMREQWAKDGEYYTHESAKCCDCHAPLTIWVTDRADRDHHYDPRQYSRCVRCVRLELLRLALGLWQGDVKPFGSRDRPDDLPLPELEWDGDENKSEILLDSAAGHA